MLFFLVLEAIITKKKENVCLLCLLYCSFIIDGDHTAIIYNLTKFDTHFFFSYFLGEGWWRSKKGRYKNTRKLWYLFPVQACYVIGYIKLFIPELFFSFSMLMKGIKGICFWLGLISSMRLDGRKDIQSIKSTCSILHC